MSITAEQIITDLTVKNYELEAAIKELKIRNQELREKNELLEEKHWSECRQIALYDNELKEAKRMATIYDFVRMCNNCGDCEECPMIELQDEIYNGVYGCVVTISEHPEKVSEVVSKWCAEHPENQEQPESVSEQPTTPKKTYKEDFLEKFPDAERRMDGSPSVCRNKVYNCGGCFLNKSCTSCWNEVMPDATD